MTQDELAKKCGVSQTTIYRAENNFEKVKFGLAIRILENVNWEMNLNQTKKLKKKELKINLISKNIYLNEQKTSLFFDIIKKDQRIWAYFNYDPASCANVFMELMKIKIKNSEN